jgi:UDP-glucose 4-epimerase
MKYISSQVSAVLGAGFIGRALIRNLLLKSKTVRVLDRNSCPSEFLGNTQWIKGVFEDKRALRDLLDGVSVAYHLVSSTVPGDQHVDAARELHDNVVSTLQFIDVCLEVGVKRIVFASSASVYGVQELIPIKESAMTNPISTHGINKLAIEKFLLLAKYQHDISVQILRISNPYGPGQNISGRQGFIGMTIGHILSNSPVLLRNQGLAIRDYIYIDDLAAAFALAGELNDSPSVMNVGSGRGHSLRDVINIFSLLLNKSIATNYSVSRSVDIPSSILDIELFQAFSASSHGTNLREGLIKTLNFHGFSV